MGIVAVVHGINFGMEMLMIQDAAVGVVAAEVVEEIK